MLLHAQRFKDAASAFRKLLDTDPNHPGARARLAIALQESGDIEGAINLYQQAASETPNSAEIYYNLGTAYKRSFQFDQAIGAYQIAVQHAPNAGELRYSLGVACIESGRFKEAADAFEWLAQHEPRRPRALDYLSYARVKLSEGEAALATAHQQVKLFGEKPCHTPNCRRRRTLRRPTRRRNHRMR